MYNMPIKGRKSKTHEAINIFMRTVICEEELLTICGQKRGKSKTHPGLDFQLIIIII